ncbi:pyridoxal-dependent decarboxylase domain-containing protein 1 [Nematolebias whitei]|uniref:pyridoxal-dependent decarboxylase domain-containing protein 1 n=1 Tax=Nematolebias whitei TaxID=451745 RepID=UPI0018993601|nr:pyridoxal-dependent decarboxylase domain-containing protein 1 [Nematolebias whitei]
MTLTSGQWLGLPAVTAVTLYRHEDPALSLAAGLTSSQPVEKLRALPLWLSLQHLGHNGILQKISHATSLSQQLLLKLKSVASIKTLVEDEENSPVVLFRFYQEMNAGKGSSVGSEDGFSPGEKKLLDTFNRWLGEQLAHLVPTSGVDVVELEDEGTCVRFSPLVTAAVLGTQQKDVEDLLVKLVELVPTMHSTMNLRHDFREETHCHSPSLRYMEELSWPGLGVVRYEPQVEGMDESRMKQELESMNNELLKKLQELDTDIVFSTGPEFVSEENCIFVGMVTKDLDVSELASTITSLGREIEESGRLFENMTERVRKGILEAELQLQKDNEDKLMEEGMLRQLPLVGSVLNWFSPVQSSIKGRTFNLAAGSLDSTDVMFSTKAQEGTTTLQDPPTVTSKKLPGQKLFRRSGGGSDFVNETSSMGQTEETSREDSTSVSTTTDPSTSPPVPETPHPSASDGTAQNISETWQQVETEGQEVEQSGR